MGARSYPIRRARCRGAAGVGTLIVVSGDDRLFMVGGIYEDCAYHPCLCTEVDEDERELTESP